MKPFRRVVLTGGIYISLTQYTTGRDRASRAYWSTRFRVCTSLAPRPRTAVFGLETRLRVRILKVASYAIDSSHQVLGMAFVARSEWKEKMTLSLLHTFVFNCLSRCFWATAWIFLIIKQTWKRKTGCLNRLLAYLRSSVIAFAVLHMLRIGAIPKWNLWWRVYQLPDVLQPVHGGFLVLDVGQLSRSPTRLAKYSYLFYTTPV